MAAARTERTWAAPGSPARGGGRRDPARGHRAGARLRPLEWPEVGARRLRPSRRPVGVRPAPRCPPLSWDTARTAGFPENRLLRGCAMPPSPRRRFSLAARSRGRSCFLGAPCAVPWVFPSPYPRVFCIFILYSGFLKTTDPSVLLFNPL